MGAAECIAVQPALPGATQMFWFHVVSVHFTVGGYILGFLDKMVEFTLILHVIASIVMLKL